jgi:light-regulated signal transduction histidine kinase (bacteriophytochrome)
VFREGAVRDYPLEIRHRDGSLTEVLYNASTYRHTDGRVAGVFAAARDVGELKRAEAKVRALNAELEGRVEERTRELAAANRELQEFVYSVAHDLRTPLRAVDGFSLTVLEDYGDVIAGQGRADLERVRAAAQSMGELIDALLSLSRMGHIDVRLEPVDLSAIARRVTAELREAYPARRVEVVIEDGLEVVGDVALLDLVLENLLGNAWKFTSDRADARVEFRQTEHHGHRAFLVRDNGAGFDPAYVNKLFKPFQRLHTVEEFPGTGIGLATVARALERLGGSWWAEGEVGAGATFFFALGDGADTPADPRD